MTIVLSEDTMPTLTRHPLKSGALQLASRPWPPRRAMPSGLDQQGRYLTRAVRSERWADTVATDYGSADALGDDQAQRHSAWGAIDESAAPEGGRHREPSRTMRDAPGLLASLLWPLGVVASVAAVVALLPSGWIKSLIG